MQALIPMPRGGSSARYSKPRRNACAILYGTHADTLCLLELHPCDSFGVPREYPVSLIARTLKYPHGARDKSIALFGRE